MLGVKRVEEPNGIYFVASPWKALADLCYVQKKDWKSLSDLCDDLRIEIEELQERDQELLEELSQKYGSTHVRHILSRLRS